MHVCMLVYITVVPAIGEQLLVPDAAFAGSSAALPPVISLSPRSREQKTNYALRRHYTLPLRGLGL